MSKNIFLIFNIRGMAQMNNNNLNIEIQQLKQPNIINDDDEINTNINKDESKEESNEEKKEEVKEEIKEEKIDLID